MQKCNKTIENKNMNKNIFNQKKNTLHFLDYLNMNESTNLKQSYKEFILSLIFSLCFSSFRKTKKLYNTEIKS